MSESTLERVLICEALDLGLQAWRTTPSRERFVEAVAALGRLAAERDALEEALRLALDCRGSYNGTVSQYGGEPAICTKCEEVARRALAAAATPEEGE